MLFSLCFNGREFAPVFFFFFFLSRLRSYFISRVIIVLIPCQLFSLSQSARRCYMFLTCFLSRVFVALQAVASGCSVNSLPFRRQLHSSLHAGGFRCSPRPAEGIARPQGRSPSSAAFRAPRRLRVCRLLAPRFFPFFHLFFRSLFLSPCFSSFYPMYFSILLSPPSPPLNLLPIPLILPPPSSPQPQARGSDLIT